MKAYKVGVDVGYSSVKIAVLDDNNNLIFEQYRLHKGKIRDTLMNVLEGVRGKLKNAEVFYGAVTGSYANYITGKMPVQSVNEVSADIEGSVFLNPEAKSVIEIGGQSARYYTGFNVSGRAGSTGKNKNMLQISSNSDCAAGTGSFLEEQAARLNIKIEDYSKYVEKAKSIPRIAGRCSVFAKTDIIHHQQEGIPSEDILKGVAYSIIKNYRGSVIRRLPVDTPVLFVGGVARNRAVIDALRDVLQKNESELIVPCHFDTVGAIGAAIIAGKECMKLDFQKFCYDFSCMEENSEDVGSDDLVPLYKIPVEDITQKHKLAGAGSVSAGARCYLGVDIGSTSTNLVLINSGEEIVSYEYIRTKGNPLRAVQEGMKKINVRAGGNVNIAGVGITGSGRTLTGKQIGADVIRDEITAQAKAAVKIDPETDTIFEIGGQDSKYISINGGTVTDFQMNKVCAAGTGSFLDEQAEEFNIPVEELGNLAFKSEHPVSLGERCTVFIKSGIASCLSRGKKIEDIVAGLCYSIAKNYLHRVVGQKKIGGRIMLQGGIAFNQGVANAFRLLTNKKITTSPFFSVTGAYGAALMACEEMAEGKTKFIGIDALENLSVSSPLQEKPEEKSSGRFNKRIEETIFEDYDTVMDPRKKTVGIPRALFTYGMFPMFNAIFKSLGFNVLLSDWSSESTIKLGQEFAMEETCFPVKLILGHVAELVSKGVDYIFFPDLYTIDHPGSESRKNFGCAYMQLAFKIVNHTMELDKKGIKLLAPTFAFSMGKDFMQKEFSGLGNLLGKSKEETGMALQKGMEAFSRFEKRMASNGKKSIEKTDPDKITFVIISKTYGVADSVLNLGIPDKLMDMGYQVIPFFDMPEGVNVSKEHPNMYWPFGQHILEPAYLIREHPNMYAIFLTHHGCGPDSVLLHFFREIMGEKPYLNIEIDEHASKVGVTTRIEAFVNSLKPSVIAAAKNPDRYIKDIKYKKMNICYELKELNPCSKIYIPNVYPYSELFKTALEQKGFEVGILKTNEKTIGLGRKQIMTNEYFSLTSLLGDCFNVVENISVDENVSFLIPQTEGAEVEGQYNRILRTKLDEYGYNNIGIAAPFLEDAILLDDNDLKLAFYCILAGDLINIAPFESRNDYISRFQKVLKRGVPCISDLEKLANDIYSSIRGKVYRKRIMALGESQIIYNDFLNNYTFKRLEEKQYKIIYGLLSEAVLIFWSDYIKPDNSSSELLKDKLSGLEKDLYRISALLKEESPFAGSIAGLLKKADDTIGFYAGAFARYRESKSLCCPANADGIITAASLYENTGISLNILHKGFSDENTKPVLNLTFDGNKNENNKSKVESFIYYL